MSDTKLKGVVFFFVNFYPDLGQDIELTVKMIRDMNKPMLDMFSQDGRYVVILVPTTKEATRVEKVDFDAPFPRFMHKSVDVQKEGIDNGRRNKKTAAMFQGDEKVTLQGMITLFVNFHPEMDLDVNMILTLIRTINEDTIKRISEDGQYQLMIIPTTKEASRVEKIDYEMAFPRLVPKKVEKTKTGVVQPRIPVLHDDEDDDEDDDDDNDDNFEGEEDQE